MKKGKNMSFDFDNNIPIYIQLVEQIKISIISGDITSGDRLPSVREWAMKYKVNPNTMQKALAELEAQGLVFTERTNGKFVTENKALIEIIRKDYAKEMSERYFISMEKIGFSKDKAIEYLNALGGKEE